MDFTVLPTSGYRNDCDREDTPSAIASAPINEALPAPAESRPRKEKHKDKRRKGKKDKDKKEKKKEKKKSSRRVKLAEPVQIEPAGDKGKARRDPDANGTASVLAANVESVSLEGYAMPAILELVFAAATSDPPALAEFPLPVQPSNTVAEIKEELFQRERYLLRTMQFFYEGRELKNLDVFRNLGVRNHSTIHLRNVFSAINIQPAFGEPYPLAYTGPTMTVIDLLSALLTSPRFHFANPRFFRLSLSKEGDTVPVYIDLENYIQYPDEPLPWDKKMSEFEDKLGNNWFTSYGICLQPWNSPGDYTSVKVTDLTANMTVREVDAKMRKELNAHRRADAPAGFMYMYKLGEAPYGNVVLEGDKSSKRQMYFSWRRPPPGPVKFKSDVVTTLAQLGIQAGSTLHIDFWSEASSRWTSTTLCFFRSTIGSHSREVARKYTYKGIQLRIAFPSGRLIMIPMGINELVELLMWKIFCAVGFLPEDQLLVLQAKQLSREQSLSAQGVKEGDTINVVRRVRAAY